MFVRTEQRPGSSAPEHFYVSIRERNVWHRWSAEPLPGLELIHDPAATAHAEAVEEEMAKVRSERAALLRVIREALPMVPVVTATAMRAAYREAMGRPA